MRVLHVIIAWATSQGMRVVVEVSPFLLILFYPGCVPRVGEVQQDDHLHQQEQARAKAGQLPCAAQAHQDENTQRETQGDKPSNCLEPGGGTSSRAAASYPVSMSSWAKAGGFSSEPAPALPLRTKSVRIRERMLAGASSVLSRRLQEAPPCRASREMAHNHKGHINVNEIQTSKYRGMQRILGPECGLTVGSNERVGRQEGQQREQGPEAELDHPAPVVPAVPLLALVFHTNQDQGKQGEESLHAHKEGGASNIASKPADLVESAPQSRGSQPRALRAQILGDSALLYCLNVASTVTD